MTGTKQYQIDFIPTPVYLANKKAFKEGFSVICNEGGSRSGKTYSIVQLLIHIACFWQPGVRVTIVSRSLPHLKQGALRDFKKIMKDWKMWSLDNWNATDNIFNFDNGSYIEFIGLEEPEKAHGPSRDILYINEANYLRKALYDQLSQRTTQCEFLDWNPAEFTSWVYDLADDGKSKIIHSTFRNNLSNLPQKIIDKIMSYKELADDFMWNVYGLGLRGASAELIYPKWKEFKELPNRGNIFYGLDFGFVHPSALVRCELYEGAFYVEEKIYLSGLTKPELFDKIKAIVEEDAVIYADAAEPDSIEELYRMGLNIKPADKDVWNGIVTVKAHPLFISGVNIKSEIGGYKWKKDKNENLIEEPVKEKDDLMDAMRYAIYTHLNKPQISWEW